MLNERQNMFVELEHKQIEVICSALIRRSQQLRLEHSVSGLVETINLAEELESIANQMLNQSRQSQVQNYLPGL